MQVVRDQAFIMATIKQTFILFKLLINGEKWTLDKHNECGELIFAIADLKRELASTVGDEEAHNLVKNAYASVFSEE